MRTFVFTLILLILLPVATYAQEVEPENFHENYIIDSIECAGNLSTDCEIIKREIYQNIGDKLDEEEVSNSKIRLQLLGLFKSVDLSLKKGIDRGHVVLSVEVAEDNPFFSETTVMTSYFKSSGFSGLNSLGVALKFGHRNLFGKGKVLQTTLEPNGIMYPDYKSYSGNIEYIDPHLFGHKRYFLSAKLQYTFNDYDLPSTSYSRTKNSTSYSLNIGHRIFDFSHIGVGVSQGNSKTISRNGENDLLIEETTESKPSYTLNYGWNSEDDPYFPTEGSKFDLTYYKFEQYAPNAFAEFKQNWLINEKNFLILTANDWWAAKDEWSAENYNNFNLGLEWGYQARRNQAESFVTDARYFLKSSANYDNYTRDNIEGTLSAGVLLDTQSLGILKLGTFFVVER